MFFVLLSTGVVELIFKRYLVLINLNSHVLKLKKYGKNFKCDVKDNINR